MCDSIFPEVDSCCGLVSVRVGMVLIAVLSITTGAATLGVMEQRKDMSYDSVMQLYKNVSNYTQPDQVLSDLSNLIPMTITFMTVVFMCGGLALLYATFADQEGFAQMFVWLIFCNIVVGCVVVVAISFECVWVGTACLLGGMDWLSGSTALIAFLCYLAVWYYFCCVANSYVLNASLT